MATSRLSQGAARLLAFGLLTALLPLALACDNAVPRPDPDPGPDPIDDPTPVEVDAEALAATFGCEVYVVALGEQAEGELADSGCFLDDGRRAVYYAFGVDEAAVVTVEAGSAWFDTFLFLHDGGGAILYENDDLDDFDTNSRLEAALDRGVYVVLVTSCEVGEEGFYRFRARR